MVTYVQGDIFKSPAQVLTNTVNCVGVMGKGVALEFKNRYPLLFADYKNRCDRNEVKLGEPYLWEDDHSQILNFPTKRHWKNSSQLQDIDDGLKFIADNYESMGMQSLAMPALGCGLGGLKWSSVQPLIEKHLGFIPDLDVYVYEPKSVQAQKNFNEGIDDKSKCPASGIAARQLDL